MRRFISKRELRNLIGISPTQVDRLEHEAKFPTRVTVGCRVFWLEDEIREWMDARIAERTPKPE